MTLRLLDLSFAFFGIVIGAPVLLAIYLFCLFETGVPIFRQVRVGRNQKPFVLVKFRTMQVGTDSVASHLVDVFAITPLGTFLRRMKLDELPQLFNILKGEMSLVGPRPCLFNKTELINERALLGVFDSRRGVTGLAQVHNIDMSIPKNLAETDPRMLQNFTRSSFFKNIFQTVFGKGMGDRVTAR